MRLDYTTASAQLTGRNHTSRKLANNTYLQRRGDSIAVRLHATDILTLQLNGDIVLDTGGWTTATTKARFNEFLPRGFRVHSEKGVWYLSHGSFWSFDAAGNATPNNPEYREYPYADGITIHADDTVSGIGGDPNAKLKLRRRIASYVKGYMSALAAGNVPVPSAGDCWYCALRTSQVETVDFGAHVKGKAASGFYDGTGDIPLGAAIGDTSHLISHMDEKYYVPSLLVNAIERFGVSQAAKWYLGSFWDTAASQESRDSARRVGACCVDQIRRALRRYLIAQFGMQA